MPNQLFKYFQEVSFQEVSASSGRRDHVQSRVPWFRDVDSITDRPVVRFTTV